MDKVRKQWATTATAVIALFIALSTLTDLAPHVYAGSNKQPHSVPQQHTISRDDIIARAKSWVQAHVPYSESQIDLYQGYRKDCSGFVSMAWGLDIDKPGLTTYTLPTVSHQINKDDLQPGDVLNNIDGGGNPNFAHVVIFDSWVDSSHTHYNAYEEVYAPGYYIGAHYTQNIPYPYWSGYYNSQLDYTPMRLNSLSNPTTSKTTTVPMPPTQTSCPAIGTARAAIMAPLALGSHQNIVYIDNEAQNNGPDIGTIKRYDVTTRTTTDIVRLKTPGSISEAQVSADGQWLLFVVYTLNPTDFLSEIQMIRMDGQGLQTLYCSSRPTGGNISDIQWSPDHKSVVFNQGNSLYLLDLTSGQLISQQSQGLEGKKYIPITWLDSTRVYADGSNFSQPLCNYILGTGTSSSRTIQNLQLTGKTCSDGDQGFYGAAQFINQCNCNGNGRVSGPSSIMVRSTIDGSSKTIYSSQTFAITNLWVVSSTKLMLRIGNLSGDTSQNGLWTINMDGTGLKKVISDADLSQNTDNNDAHITGEQDPYPYWKNSSRDGSLYTIFAWNPVNADGPCNMYVGSLNGGSLIRFASFTNCMPDSLDIIDLTENLLEIIGWTTM